MSKNDGGPAFPVAGMMHGEKLGGQLAHGMSLREYYIAHVEVPADLPMSWGEYWVSPWPAEDFQAQMRWWIEVYAKYKALHADAMLAERAK